MALCFEAINDKEEIRCDKCNCVFKNKHTLNIHKYTSEKCCENYISLSTEDKVCFYCNKKFSSKQMKKYHEFKCTSRIIYNITKDFEKEIEDLKINYENKIKELQITICKNF